MAQAARDRDAAVAEALRQRDDGVAAANTAKQQVLNSEQTVKDAAAKAQQEYTDKLNALNGRSGQLDQREQAVTQREQAVQQRETAVQAAEAGVNASAFKGDGLFLVGRDIQPGTYQSAGPASSGAGECYAARLSSTKTSDIIDNQLSAGQVTVTIDPSDVALDVTGCQAFKKVG